MFYYSQKYRLLKFVAPETYYMLKFWPYPFLLFVILQKTQLDLFRNKFVHNLKMYYTQKQLQGLPRQSMIKYYSMKCEQKLANGFE